MDLNVILPINSVSFGDVGYNIMYELFKRDIKPNFFPINLDVQSFDKTPGEFANYLGECASKSLKTFKRTYPCFKLWHIQGSENSVSNSNHLFTFRELDQISEIEANILNNHETIFVSCEETKRTFEDFGVTSKVVYCPLGFDSLHYFKKEKRNIGDDRIFFLINGKVEKRKRTKKAIQLWLKKFGYNPKYVLNLAVQNPHFKPEQMNGIYADIFNGQKPPFNVNILPFLKTKGELNDLYNQSDIIIDASSYETWSIPSFTCVALGKHAVIHNCGGVKGWATKDNSCLFYPSGKEIAHDGVFFNKDKNDFGFGNWFIWEDEAYVNALEESVKRFEASPVNTNGLQLQEKFKYSNTVDIILKEICK
jgi:hypothetical protein